MLPTELIHCGAGRAANERQPRTMRMAPMTLRKKPSARRAQAFAGPLALVVALGDHLAVAEHNGAHRHVVVADGQSGLVEGELHRGIEIHGVRRYRLRRAALAGGMPELGTSSSAT